MGEKFRRPWNASDNDMHNQAYNHLLQYFITTFHMNLKSDMVDGWVQKSSMSMSVHASYFIFLLWKNKDNLYYF
jgi:hypothetical protein